MSIAKIDNGEKGRFVGRLFGFFFWAWTFAFLFQVYFK
jgi:hypothetical protein